MKTLSAGMQEHVEGDVTTLATCWRITRTDGVVHRFTDHDLNVRFPEALSLTVPISAGETYAAVGAFTRTNIDSKSGLRVDNLELVGVINSDEQAGGIPLADLQARRLLDAEVEVFMVNWADPTMGVIPLKRGHLGDVVLNKDAGTYEAELRGLSARYARKLGEVYSAKCRADLFDARCKLAADDYAQRSVVESVSVARKAFTVPALRPLVGASPGLSSGARSLAMVGADGQLRLRPGPAELGTRDAPFVVATPADLDAVRDNPLAWYALAGDVDMSSFGFFEPIADFRGGLDGRGHAIVGLDVDRPGNGEPDGEAALFGRLLQGAVVRRLGIVGGRFHGGNSASFFAAPLAARTDAVAQVGEYGVVEDCYAIGCEVLTDATASPDRLSGLLGEARGLLAVRRCFSAVVLHAPAATQNWSTRVGNVVADTNGATPQVLQDCYVDDERAGVGTENVGAAGAGAPEKYGLNEDPDGVEKLSTAEARASSSMPGLGFGARWVRPEGRAAAEFVPIESPVELLDFNDNFPARPTIVRDQGSWISDGFEVGDRIDVAGAGGAIATTPASTSFTGASSLSLDLVSVTGVDLVALGWKAGQVVAISSNSPVNGGRSARVRSVASSNLSLAAGEVLQTGGPFSGVELSTGGNSGRFDVVEVSDSTLTLALRDRLTTELGVVGTTVQVTAAKYPRARRQQVP